MKRPPKKYLERFGLWQIGDDTVADYLRKGWSLAICCRACTRPPVAWTPPELELRFGKTPTRRIDDIAKRLADTGPGGCGSKDVAVYPVPYEEPWSWAKT